MEKNVLFIAYQIPPVAGAATQRHLRFLVRLPALGWRPKVLSVKKSSLSDYYLQDESLENKMPEGTSIYRAGSFNPLEIYLEFKSNKKKSLHNPLVKNQTPYSYENNRSLFSSIKDFISDVFRFPDRQIGWFPFAVLTGLLVCLKEKCCIIYSSGSPWTAHLVGVVVSRLLNLPLVTDFRDPWVLNPYKSKKNELLERVEKSFEAIVVRCSTYVIANTSRLRESFLEAYPSENSSKFVHIGNGYNEDDFEGTIGFSNFEPDDRLRLSHVGTLYGPRNPNELFLAVSDLKKEGTLSKNNFALKFVGKLEQIKDYQSRIADLNIEDLISFSPPVPHSQALREILSSDVQLIIQPDTALQVPGKLFEYIASSKPILAIACDGATSDIVLSESLGYVVKPGDLNGLKNVLRQLLSAKGDRSLSSHINPNSREKFESKHLTNQLKNLFSLACEEKR